MSILCDRRRSVGEYQCLFPAIDFSLIESDEDVLWKANERETKEELANRGKVSLIGYGHVKKRK